MKSKDQFKDKFIAFVDILGYKDKVIAAEAGNKMSLPKLMGFLNALGNDKDRSKYDDFGPLICPYSKYIEKNIDFQITQISDCVIVSSEVSPAGVINITNHCWSIAIRLLKNGIMCRGYITRGSIFHTPTQIIGTGYQEAFEKESNVDVFKQYADEKGTPFIEIDQVVLEYIDHDSDECIKKMFSRMVKQEGDSAAIFPFSMLSHSFGIGGFFGKFDPEKERQSNRVVREMLQTFKEKIISYVKSEDKRALELAGYYIRALDAQLEVCDVTDDQINMLCSQLPH